MLTASFLVNPNLLAVQFIDSSIPGTIGTIASWAWNFGDPSSGGSNTSAIQSPLHTFTAPGTYIVSLAITDTNSVTVSTTRNIIVNTIPVLPVTIKDFVKIKLPAPIVIPPGAIDAYVAEYQLFMQPLVNFPGVADTDTYNELAYPPLVNALIAMSAAYNILLDYAALNAAAGSSVANTGGAGAIKKIETGPSNAEWHDPAAYAKLLHGKDGIIQTLRNELCTLARRMMINMPMCPPLPSPILQSKKAGRLHNHNQLRSPLDIWGLYPYTIPLIC